MKFLFLVLPSAGRSTGEEGGAEEGRGEKEKTFGFDEERQEEQDGQERGLENFGQGEAEARSRSRPGPGPGKISDRTRSRPNPEQEPLAGQRNK